MGTNQKHTPGPWTTDPEGHIRAPYPNHAPGISIARMTCFGAHDVHMAMGANAALISAAPDMLAALEAALALLQDPDATDTDADKVEALLEVVILKAKGSR